MSTIEAIKIDNSFSFLEDMVVQSSVIAGPYEVRFAQNTAEVEAAQALRFRVFYTEKQGNPTAEMIKNKRDMDQWDEPGFHVIVLDKRSEEQPKVVGTLRLLFNESLNEGQNFYTEETFDLSKLKSFYGRSLELSRFCIDPDGRGGVILLLIWKYAMSFLQDNQIDVMFGCASFAGNDAEKHLPILNYLYKHHLAPASLMPRPKDNAYIDLNLLCGDDADWSNAQKSIPTLLRGYLKLGAKISDAAIIDHSFNTVYVSIYVETKNMLNQNPNLVMHV